MIRFTGWLEWWPASYSLSSGIWRLPRTTSRIVGNGCGGGLTGAGRRIGLRGGRWPIGGSRLVGHCRLFRSSVRHHLVGDSPQQGYGRRLFPRRPQPRLVHRGRLDLFLEHRFRAPGQAGRLRLHRWRAWPYELHAWCLLVLAWVFVPFTCGRWSTRCPNFSKSDSRRPPDGCCRSSRWWPMW